MSFSATGVPASSGMAVIAAERAVELATRPRTLAFFSSMVAMVSA